MNKFDVFICYAEDDQESVEQLVKKLKQDGFRVWFDIEQTDLEALTIGQIADGIANSAHMLVCLSDAYLTNRTLFELEAAHSLDPTNRQNRMILAQIGPLSQPLPPQIETIEIVELTDLANNEGAYRKISHLLGQSSSQVERPLSSQDSLERLCEAPFSYLNVPNAALFQARIATTAICEFLCRQELRQVSADANLDELVEKLKSANLVPSYIRPSLSTLQSYGDFPARGLLDNLNKRESGISPVIYQRLRKTLMECGPFSSDQELSAVFVNGRINSFKDKLPQTTNQIGRVDAVIDYLHNKQNEAGENGLVAFLSVLSEGINPGDICHGRLAKLAEDLQRMQSAVLTQELIQPGLAALKLLTDWVFEKYFDQPEKDDLWDLIWNRLPYQKGKQEREIPGSHYTLKPPRLSLNSLGPLYSGRDTTWGRSVTINLAAVPETADAAFFEEVSQFIRLNDASIVRPLDANQLIVNDERLCLYVVLEHVDGASVQDIVDRYGSLPHLAVYELCRGVAIALEGLHTTESGIIHGDIKPGNVMVDRFGRVKVLCIGRNLGVTVEDASAGIARGKIDSFLFSSPEQLSGAQNLSPETDLFALRTMLFYLLTGEYESRTGDEMPDMLDTAREIGQQLAVCNTAREAREILDSACQKLVNTSMSIRAVIDCYQQGLPLQPMSPQRPDIEVKSISGDGGKEKEIEEFALRNKFIVEGHASWPLGNGRVLVWEAGADTLAILAGDELLWRDAAPMRIRGVAYGPENRLAVTGWEGQVRCFAVGKLVASLNLDGVIGAAQFCADRWIIGTWKQTLISVDPTGEVSQLLNVDKGVFCIAATDAGDWFAVADLRGGIDLYNNAQNIRVATLPPANGINSMAFAGKRLMLLSGQSLLSVNLNGRLGNPERLPENSSARLLPGPDNDQCILLADQGNAWLIDESGRQLPYVKLATGQRLLAACGAPKRFIIALPDGGCAYWRADQQQQAWPEALTASLSFDGRYLTVTSPGKIELYEDPII